MTGKLMGQMTLKMPQACTVTALTQSVIARIK